LKEKTGIEHILEREHEMVNRVFDHLQAVSGLKLFADQHRQRLGVFSFIIDGLHYNLGVKLLNDRFGIQVRGGCSCAGTYGHYLLEVDRKVSDVVTCQISHGDLSGKPGWIRMSVHPSMTNGEIDYICQSIEALATHHREWATDYLYNPRTNEFTHRRFDEKIHDTVVGWFDL
jgi:selenocysteine lyase/cysteine desulfurase